MAKNNSLEKKQRKKLDLNEFMPKLEYELVNVRKRLHHYQLSETVICTSPYTGKGLTEFSKRVI